MAYEIDFVGSSSAKKDYDAIAFRYWSCIEKRWIVCVFDGGTADAGDDLCRHLSLYYLNGETIPIDYVFCSHPHEDHASGLRSVFQNFTVRYLVMNRPLDYCLELFPRVSDGRITSHSLAQRLVKGFSFVQELKQLATQKHCKIIPALAGTRLTPEMQIMSPSRAFYVQCLCESDKTPTMESIQATTTKTAFGASDDWVKATWGKDDIREDVFTSADNESSIVLHVAPQGDRPFLLVGDVGCKGLKEAMDYADGQHIPLNACSFLQIPHQGGRHNVSPSVLDRLVGPKLPQGAETTKVAFVSACKGSDHPRRSVVNAFLSRGCKVFVSKENSLWHHVGTSVPKRVRYGGAHSESFYTEVEAWK